MREKYQKALACEQTEAWNKACDEVEMEVAQVADQLLEIYPMATNLLVKLFKTMEAVDLQVDRINETVPDGILRRLRKSELVARGIDNFSQDNLRITEKCQLPELVVGNGTSTMLWPPPKPNIGLDYAMMVAAACGVPSTADDCNWEHVFDPSAGHYVWNRKAGAPPPPQFNGPDPMQPGETVHDYTLRQQAKRAEESARHIAFGEKMEAEHQRLNAEAARRAEEQAAERRRVEAGG